MDDDDDDGAVAAAVTRRLTFATPRPACVPLSVDVEEDEEEEGEDDEDDEEEEEEEGVVALGPQNADGGMPAGTLLP